MKAISIREPWSTLIRKGEKTIETRTWRTHYRGTILLCCSKKPSSSISGMAFATAEIKDCRPMTKEDESKALCEIYPRAFSWILTNVTSIVPFEVKGSLGFFNVDCQNKEELEFY